MYRARAARSDYGAITTEILDAPEFYFAEDYHQQYLAKNPMGYCGLGGTGVSCPIGAARPSPRTRRCRHRDVSERAAPCGPLCFMRDSHARALRALLTITGR